jgi:WD40 repeat protein
MAKLTLRVFLSSPGDVGLERLLAVRVLERLQGEFANAVTLEPILWENLPLRATGHFQEQIIPPSETDIVVTILWSRLGTRLPADTFHREDGSTYQSGTEWEIEDAVRSYRERGTPDLFVYRKTSDPLVSLSREDEIAERLRQKKALDAFIDHWFGNPRDSFKAAFTTFETPDQFEEQLETHLRAVVRERLPARATGEAHPATWHSGSPFRRLEVFEFEHAPIFFGRTQAVGAVCEALKRQAALDRAFVMVLGMSGCGKSSLVRAGVLPVLTQPGIVEGVDLWRRCVFRPGDSESDPLEALAHALVSAEALPELEALNFSVSVLADHLRRAPQVADGPLRIALARAAEAEQARDRLPRRPEARLAVVVDQLEEIFTRTKLSASDREKFLAALARLARSGVAWVVATMRSDFYARCAELPELVALKERSGQYDLLPVSLGELGQVIRHPALAAGLEFEEDSATGLRLDELLHEDACKNSQSLPLLEFTLDELYQRRTDSRLLTLAAYQALGGLEGALVSRAEATVLALRPEVQETLTALMLALVTSGEGEHEPAVSHRVPLEPLQIDPIRRQLLDALIDARLLVTDRDVQSKPVVGVAHEALLTHWPRLRTILEEDREFLRSRSRVLSAEQNWRKKGCDVDFLLPEGKTLAEAREVLGSPRSELNPGTIAFIGHSIRRAQRNQRLRTCAVVCLFGLTIIAFVLAVLAKKNSDIALTEADRSRQLARIADAERLAALSLTECDSAPQRGLLLAVEGLNALKKSDPRVASTEQSLRHALARSGGQPLAGHAGRILAAWFSGDGRRILTSGADGTARVWDADQPLRPPVILNGHKGGVIACFSPDGKQVLTASEDRTARLWTIIPPENQSFVLPAHDAGISAVCVSPDGRRMLTASADGEARLWDAPFLGKPPVIMRGHAGGILTAAFSSDGRRIVTAGADRNAMLWDADDSSKRPAILRGHQGAIHVACFSPDGRLILTASDDKSARLWKVENRIGEYTILGEHEDVLRAACFSPDGRLVLTASWDGTARLWDVNQPRRSIAVFRGHVGRIESAAFSPDGRRVVTGGSDKTARLWQTDHPQSESVVLRGHEDTLRVVRFSPDGGRILTAGEDSVPRTWEISRPFAEPVVLRSGGEAILSACFSPDHQRILTAGEDRSARLWDLQHLDREPTMLRGHEGRVTTVRFSRDGHRILTAGYDKTVRLWDTQRLDKPTAILPGHRGSILAADFSPDGRRVVSAGLDRVALLWDTEHMRAFSNVLVGHKGSVGVARFSPDGRRLLTASHDGTAQIWDTNNLKKDPFALRGFIGPILAADFSPDSRRVVAAGDGEFVRLWDLERPEIGSSFLSGHEGAVLAACFSPDGLQILTAGADAKARIWDVNSLTGPAVILDGQDGAVATACFSPDGHQFLTAGKSATVRVWLAHRDDLIHLAGRTAGRNLTRAEWAQYFGVQDYRPTFPELPTPD